MNEGCRLDRPCDIGSRGAVSGCCRTLYNSSITIAMTNKTVTMPLGK